MSLKQHKYTKYSELIDIFHDDHTPLEHRLQIATRVFSVGDLNTVKNKETTLLWLESLLRDEEHRNDVYAVLKHCIINTTDVWLHPQLSDFIISILTKSQSNRNAMECCSELLKSVHFLRYFIHNLQKMSDVMVFVVNALAESDIQADFISEIQRNVVDCLLTVKTNALYNHDLKIVFFNGIIQTLAVIANNNCNLVPTIENCFYQVLFTDTEFRNMFTKYLDGSRAENECDQYVVNIIDNIRSFRNNLSNELLTSCYGLLLSGYLLSNSSFDGKFRVFVALNNYVQISPYPFADESCKKIVFDSKSTSVVIALMEKILKYDLPLDSTMGSFNLTDWLNVLTDEVLDNVKDTLNVDALKLMKRILSCSPHTIEYCIKKFARNVMMTKKSDPEVISMYSDLCLDVLNVYIKLNRMQKLISALLVMINENLASFNESTLPDKFHILPEQIFTKIQSAVTNLPSTVQNVALLNTLLYHLEKDCIAKLKSDQSKQVDPRLVLVFDVVTYLISRFISGTRIVDHSVPDLVKNKFEELMRNLGGLLGEFGKAMITKEHYPKLMEAFLHLSYIWGEIQMVFMVYESYRRRVPKQVGNNAKSATNLVYLHPYLTDFHWVLIAQRVVNFGDTNCLKLLYDLILQKINALPYLEDELEGPFIDDGPATVCAYYLINNADSKWIMSHVAVFVHLLKPHDIFTMAKSIVGHYENCADDEVYSINQDIQEIRPLVISLLCWTFYSISKQFGKCGIKEIRRILHAVDFEKMLKAEIGEDDEKTEAEQAVANMIDGICSLISKDFEYIDYSDEISIERNITFLVTLSNGYLSKENKSVMFYLSLSLIKSIIKLKPKTKDLENCLNNACRLLLNFHQDIITPETLEITEELVWIYRGLIGSPYCQAVLERLCEITDSSYESVVASEDSYAEKNELSQSEVNVINLDVSDYVDQLSEQTVENFSKLNRYLRLAEKEKNHQIKQRILAKACRLVQKYISGKCSEEVLSILPVTEGFLKIFTEIIQNRKFHIRYAMIDLCFELISFAVNVKNTEDALLVEAIELLFGITKVRLALVLDRIPTFYLCYKNLFLETAKRSAQTDRNIETLMCAAHKLEKLTDVLYKHKKDFTKTSISAVADFVGVFAECSVEEGVKMHLKNVINCWIGISDTHVHQYLSSTLNPVSQKLFQQFSSDYNKYFKFSGKV